MKSQWMTTLFSKGLALESALRGSITNLQEQVKKELEKKGLRATPEDIAAFIEEISPTASVGFLDIALKYFRPFHAQIGLRVSQFADEHVEIIVPSQLRTSHPNGHCHEAALIAAGQEAQRLLWTRHAPLGSFDISILNIQLQKTFDVEGKIRCRMDLPESQREAIISLLRDKHTAEVENQIVFFNEHEINVATMHSKIKIIYMPALGTHPAE